MSYYTLGEVQKHNTSESLWTIIDNHIFDLTSFIDLHPGGREILIRCGGRDATRDFNEVSAHYDAFVGFKLNELEIGQLK